MVPRLPALFLIVTVLCAAVVVAQSQKTLKVNVEMVMINATVTDSDNHLLTDLKASDFQIYEDKVEQQIDYFSREEQPLSLGIVFDISHSMQNKIAVAREAAQTFLETGTRQDEYFLVEFNNHAKLAEDFTTDINRLRNHLAFSPARGATALYDAVYLGLSKVKKGSNPKKALLLITDGEDNHSRYSRGDIHEIARESDAQIYSIDLGRALVSELSDITGGHSFHGNVNDLEDICEKIAQELKSQYVIGYTSTNALKDGKYRKVRLKVNSPPGMPKLHIRAKDGYFAAAE